MKKAIYGVQNLGNSVVSCEKIFKIIDELVLLLKKKFLPLPLSETKTGNVDRGTHLQILE